MKEVALSAGSFLYENEVRALRALPADSAFPKLIGSTRRGNKGLIVMEYFPEPSLKSFLSDFGSVPSEFALRIFSQLVFFLLSLHSSLHLCQVLTP